MYVEIITIGDELLIGQVVDTNSAWMGENLNQIGAEVLRITSVRDRAEEMTAAIERALAEVDVVLLTGGLGPTKDDITKATLTKLFGGELRFDDATFEHLQKLLAERGIALNESTKSQCYVPSSCRVIQNTIGTAPIMWFEVGEKVVVSLPGVPQEMKEAMSRDILPQLQQQIAGNGAIAHASCLVKGYTESALSEYLESFELALPKEVKLAYLPSFQVIRLRLTARAATQAECDELLAHATQELNQQLGNAIFSHQGGSLAEALGTLLLEKNWSLATAESCSGGNIAHEITTVAGASAWYNGGVVSYTNRAKEELLGVFPESFTQEGAVSQNVVEEMARGACKRLHTQCAIATSGIAGPTGGTPEKPVGTVWIAVACNEEVVSKQFKFNGSRSHIIDRTTNAALMMLIEKVCVG